ncbi:MarR family transcriptional regulator [Streptomyces sp. NPDC049881]|uniref:MarR family winged helix-turn-helix transcriptional regulator n=1 Tax=unclassified Streptomyces TaxID=2593676 RepID=UPI003440EE61
MDFPREAVSSLERLLRLFRRMSTPSDLSLTAVATLSTLERTGPRRLTELAAAEGVTQPAMTQLVSRLQDAGLAARAPDPTDGRVVLVGITDEGRAFLTRRRALRAERLLGLLDQLTPEDRAALEAALPAIDALTRLALEEPRPVPDTPHTPGAR